MKIIAFEVRSDEMTDFEIMNNSKIGRAHV